MDNKRKRGRPKLFDTQIKLNLSASMNEYLEETAKTKGMHVSDVVRSMLALAMSAERA